jgi:hypothetical protein
MTTKINLPANADLIAFKAVLGAPILLSTERVDAYNEIFDGLINALRPQGTMQLLLVQQVMQETWKIMRYQRHQTLGIDRRVRVSTELQKRSRAERASKLAAISGRPATQTERSSTELSRMSELCNVIESTMKDIDALDEEGKMHQHEFVQNRAFEEGMEFQERLDRLISASTKRRDEVLRTLEHCRFDLAQRTRKLSNEIIDADVVELDRPNGPNLIEAPSHQAVVGEQYTPASFEAPVEEEDADA